MTPRRLRALCVQDGGDDCVARAACFEGEVFFRDSFGGDRRGGADRGSRIQRVVSEDDSRRGADDHGRRSVGANVSPADCAEAKQLDALEKSGIQRTWITRDGVDGLGVGDPVPLLVSLKAVNPAECPFMVRSKMQTASGAETTDLKSALNDSTVVVGDDLLVRLKVKIGDELKIGDQRFRIAAVVMREPDRMSSTMGLGPRVLISRARPGENRPAAAGQPIGRAVSVQADAGEEHCECARPARKNSAGGAGHGLSRDEPGADRGAGPRDRNAEPDLPGGDGAGRGGRGDGDARAPATAHRHSRDHEIDWRAVVGHTADLSCCRRCFWGWLAAC